MGRKRKDKRQFAVRTADPVGRGGGVDRVEDPDKHGHRYVWVLWGHPVTCPQCHGRAKRHRADHLRSKRIVSCGKVKAAAYLKHIQRQAGVDARTGVQITPVIPKRKRGLSAGKRS